MANVVYTSNLGDVLNASNAQLMKAAEIIGQMAESYAKMLCPKDTGNLQNSIDYHVTNEDGIVTVVIGTVVEYAPFVELGTGQYAEGGNGRKTPWSYQDDKGQWHTTSGNPARPYLRPAIENHIEEYKEVLRTELSTG